MQRDWMYFYAYYSKIDFFGIFTEKDEKFQALQLWRSLISLFLSFLNIIIEQVGSLIYLDILNVCTAKYLSYKLRMLKTLRCS